MCEVSFKVALPEFFSNFSNINNIVKCVKLQVTLRSKQSNHIALGWVKTHITESMVRNV